MRRNDRNRRPQAESSQSWDPVAEWYAGWSGVHGSDHHRRVAIPTVMALLELRRGERVLDVGCGPGALAAHVARAGAEYTGVDASRKLVRLAERHHGDYGRFVVGDATRQDLLAEVGRERFDAVVYLLSLQDIDPLAETIRLASGAVRSGGRLVALMVHPCFRMPRQSGWGWDPGRKLRFRRIDSYMSPGAVPMKRYGGTGGGATRSYHRPLEQYAKALASAGFLIQRLDEIPYARRSTGSPNSRAEQRSNEEIPLFLAIRALKV